MSAPKEGWPVRMLCVVIRHDTAPAAVGSVVRIIGPAEPSRGASAGCSSPVGVLLQPAEPMICVAPPNPYRRMSGFLPVAWLRPFTDPDAETQDSDAELEVTA